MMRVLFVISLLQVAIEAFPLARVGVASDHHDLSRSLRESRISYYHNFPVARQKSGQPAGQLPQQTYHQHLFRQPLRQASRQTSRQRRERHTETQPALITVLHIVARVTSRFSETVVTSTVSNPHNAVTEAKFTLDIPEKAFVSNFTMIIDGKLIVTEVKSKAEADEMYEKAKKENKTAGKVESAEPPTPEEPVAPGLERFNIGIAVKANSSIKFQLTYLQLLERANGTYDQIISLRPQQIVPDFRMQVLIYDVHKVKDLKVKEPSEKLQIAQLYKADEYLQTVTYTPTEEHQRLMDRSHGVNGEMIVSYDVVHEDDGGLLETENGYFAHHFSPRDDGYEALPKHIIFVIDISGSMAGRKIDQTRAAFLTIIDQLAGQDSFLLVLFDDELKYWPAQNEPVVASDKNKQSAKEFAEGNIHANGGTNIGLAVKTACNILRRQENPRGSNLIMFLTDGSPTAGETDPDRIVAQVSDAAAGQVAIFSLAFGMYLDFELLEKLAYRTGGTVTKIHEETNVVTQLVEFYYTIATPLFYDIKIEYPTDLVKSSSITATQFDQYFRGSEIVVVGQLQDDAADDTALKFQATVTGEAKKESDSTSISAITLSTDVTAIELPPEMSNQTGFIGKLYAYFRIKHLLKSMKLTDDETKQKELEKEALGLALEYKLVTPLTSMIIVQPDDSVESLTSDKDEADLHYPSSNASPLSLPPPQKLILVSIASRISRSTSLFWIVGFLCLNPLYLPI